MKRNQLNSRPSPSGGLCTIAEEADIDYAFLRLQKYVEDGIVWDTPFDIHLFIFICLYYNIFYRLEETNRTVQKECKNLKECFSSLARCECIVQPDVNIIASHYKG